ncbi:hypothetical protein RvY_12318 [Ramazzottius varieornatus]|uniref:Uncharacterized protein n=1 Tax=Ramazzottius varieornatus TaxID=947166 RepID=A0A1D1VPI5_RAMVA|nr:hypothetical protein RvY_12318 [Ramazzottius varieornatus]
MVEESAREAMADYNQVWDPTVEESAGWEVTVRLVLAWEEAMVVVSVPGSAAMHRRAWASAVEGTVHLAWVSVEAMDRPVSEDMEEESVPVWAADWEAVSVTADPHWDWEEVMVVAHWVSGRVTAEVRWGWEEATVPPYSVAADMAGLRWVVTVQVC